MLFLCKTRAFARAGWGCRGLCSAGDAKYASIKGFLENVAAGKVRLLPTDFCGASTHLAQLLLQTSVEDALEKLKHFDYENVGDFAKIDHHRFLRGQTISSQIDHPVTPQCWG